MREGQPGTIYLKDYQVFPWEVESVALTFELGEEYTLVTNTSRYQRRDDAADKTLLLYGEDLELMSCSLNGEMLDKSAYQLTDEGISFDALPDTAELKIICLLYTSDAADE